MIMKNKKEYSIQELFDMPPSRLVKQPLKVLLKVYKNCTNNEEKCVIKTALLKKSLFDYPKSHNQIPKIEEQIKLQKKKGKCTRCHLHAKN